MLCDKCHEKESVVRITFIIDKKKISLNLCNICLKKLTNHSTSNDPISSVYVEILIGLLSEYISGRLSGRDFNNHDKIDSWKADQKRYIDNESYNEYSEQFSDEDDDGIEGFLSPLEIRIDKLQKKLDIAVREENYEYAAILRDMIYELKQDNK